MQISLDGRSSFKDEAKHTVLIDGPDCSSSDFDPALFARLTYQEYTYCAQAIPFEAWLCDTPWSLLRQPCPTYKNARPWE